MLGLGLGGVAVGALAIWIPLDVETGLVERVRRQVTVGDALAPTLAACLVAAGALLLCTGERRAPVQPAPSATGLAFLAGLLGLIAVSLVAMRWTGPLLADAIADHPYRVLRDTRPWSFSGFAAGGTVLVAGCAALMQGRLRLRHLALGLLGVAFMIAVYDLPFDHLLLPPNGDLR